MSEDPNVDSCLTVSDTRLYLTRISNMSLFADEDEEFEPTLEDDDFLAGK